MPRNPSGLIENFPKKKCAHTDELEPNACVAATLARKSCSMNDLQPVLGADAAAPILDIDQALERLAEITERNGERKLRVI